MFGRTARNAVMVANAVKPLRAKLDAAYAEVGALRTQAYRDGILWALDELLAQAEAHHEDVIDADNVDHVRMCAADFARGTAVPHRERSDDHG